MNTKNKNIEALLDIIEESSTALEKMTEGEIDKLLSADGLDANRSITSVDAAFDKAHLLYRKSRLTKAKELITEKVK